MMHRFYAEELTETTENLSLSPAEASHAARVLRLQPGDVCGLLNGKGLIAEARIESVEKRNVLCKILSRRQYPIPSPQIRLYVAPPKGKNFDVLLKMATELGVTRISPILCRYGVSRPDEAKDSWQDPLLAACKQSGNPWLPQADAPQSLASALQNSREIGFIGAVPSREAPPQPIPVPLPPEGIALWVGPEGGFTQEEENAIQAANVRPVTVGKWILRVETAVPALLGYILAQL